MLNVSVRLSDAIAVIVKSLVNRVRFSLTAIGLAILSAGVPVIGVCGDQINLCASDVIVLRIAMHLHLLCLCHLI